MRPCAAHDRHAALGQPRNLPRVVEVVHHLVAPSQHRLDVELTGHGLARARNAPSLRDRLVRPQQSLRRHAAIERALTAHEVPLDDGDAQSRLGKTPGTDLAGRAGADHDHIELVGTHAHLSDVRKCAGIVTATGRDQDQDDDQHRREAEVDGAPVDAPRRADRDDEVAASKSATGRTKHSEISARPPLSRARRLRTSRHPRTGSRSA